MIEFAKHEPEKHDPARPHERPHDPSREPEKPEKPDDPNQPPKPEEVTPSSLGASLTASQFAALVNILRRPVVDPQKEMRQQRMREHNRRLQEDQRKMKIARFHSCNHMQLPGSVLSGCSVIAWATQTDQIKRGTCQHCQTIFSPRREECASREIWEAYAMLVRIPTHPGGNINSIFQSA